MPVWKIVVSDPESRKAYQIEIDQSLAPQLIGKRIGDVIDGNIIGLPGYQLQITGGTDKDGFPMHPNIEGSVKKKVLLSSPPCFHPRKKGERKKKTVRGNTISADIVQINMKIVKKGDKPLEEFEVIKAFLQKKAQSQQ
ncbi:MAG: 30S ribosomal protein S6e [Candidatus Aenigmatarchaeota archaeon]